jgi:hypothetical protein
MLVGDGDNIVFNIVDEGPVILESFNFVGQTVVERSPYGEQPMTIPGKIEAENFDNGGENLGFSTQINTGTGNISYRPEASSVGIELQDDGAITIGYTESQEWLKYTVNVIGGYYDVAIRYTTGIVDIMDERGIKVFLNDVEIIDYDTVSSVVDWSIYYVDTIRNVYVETASPGELSILWKTACFNLDYLEFKALNVSVKDDYQTGRHFNCYPNPFQDNINFEFELRQKSNVSLAVYNITGQKVFIQERLAMEPGKQQLNWNGMNGEGNYVASGVYFVQLNINDELLSRKIIRY